MAWGRVNCARTERGVVWKGTGGTEPGSWRDAAGLEDDGRDNELASELERLACSWTSIHRRCGKRSSSV